MNGKTNSFTISEGSSSNNVEMGYITLSSTQSSITIHHSIKNPKCAIIIPYGNSSLIDMGIAGQVDNTYCVVQYDKVVGYGFMQSDSYGITTGGMWGSTVSTTPVMTDSSCTFKCGYNYNFLAISYMYIIIGE